MAGRYIPPHLRKKGESQAIEAGAVASSKTLRRPDQGVSMEDVHNHFWPAGGETVDSHSMTLHDSAATPGKLAFIVLFNHQKKPANRKFL